MAKKHSWHFYLLTFTVGFLLVGHILWKYSPLKDEIGALLIEKLQPYIGESFIIRDFSLGFSSIKFYGISATNRRSTVNVEMEELRIGFNLFNLITHKFQISQGIEAITFHRPRLISYAGETPQPQDSLPTPERVFKKIVLGMQKIPAIDHITVEEGAIVWQLDNKYYQTSEPKEAEPQQPAFSSPQNPQDEQFVIIDGLSGRLLYEPNSQLITVDLEGKLAGLDSSSIQLTGTMDFQRRHWELTLHLDECQVTSDWPFWKLKYIQLDQARLQGEIHLENNGDSVDSLVLNGTVEVRDFSAHLFNQHATASFFTLRFQQQKLVIEPFQCRIEDGTGYFSGTIDNLLHPVADWHLDVKDYSVQHLKQSHPIFEYAYEGKIAGTARFYGPLRAMQITADLSSPAVLYAVVPFHTVNTHLHYDVAGKILSLDHMRADFVKFRTRGEGTIDFNTSQIDLDLTSDIFVPENYFSFLNRLNGSTIFLKTDFRGDFSSKLFGGKFRYFVEGADTLLSLGHGPFTLEDQLFRFRIKSDNLEIPLTAAGTIENVFSNPNFTIFDIKNFPVKEFTRNPLLANWINGRAVNLYFAGPYYSLSAKMNILSRDHLKNLLTLSANIRDIFKDNQQFRGKFIMNTAPQKISGTFDIAYSPKGIQLDLNAPDLFFGNLFVGATPDSPFTGKIHLNHFSISDYSANSTYFSQIFQEGYLQGDMTISGTIGNPDILFDLSAQDFIINKIGYYNTRLSGRLREYSLSFQDLWVELNGAPVFTANLNWNLLSDTLNLKINGEDIESNFLAETIFRNKELIKGSFTYAFVASGPSSHPAIYGDVQIKNGYVSGNPFQSIVLAFEDSLKQGGAFWNMNDHIFKVRKFLYINRDEYTVEGQGIISVDEGGPLNVRINVRGNVLAELPKLHPFFTNAHSNGYLYVNIRGTRAVPYFQEVRVKILNGSLEFANILPPLTELKADISLKDGGQFVHINTIEGMLLNHWAKIYNLEQVEVEGKPLSPWYFEEVGINFGILVLETDARGIPLSIPGLMEEGDIGYFAASGKKAGEKFYFAGPPQLPYARGKITLYNSRVTFPFIGMYDKNGESAYEDNQVVDFLKNMRWDILTVPGKNNRYFVNIPAYVGKVFMDLNIDNSSPGLEFTGRLIDDSFRTEGKVESSRGRVEYLDVKFRVDRFGAEFNRFEIFPEVYGKAYTTVRDSTSNFPIDIYLVLYVIDPVTKKEVSKGRWEDFRFKLVTQNQLFGETQEQVLSYLGYNVHNLQYKAEEVGLTMTENYLIRPLFRPLERQIERLFHLDYVRLRSRFTTNLFYLSFQDRAKLFNRINYNATNFVNLKLDPALLLLQSSEVTMGKYLFRNIYFSYSGLLVSGYEESKLGVNHSFGLEFRLLPNLLLEMEYNKFQFNPFYSNAIDTDFRVRLRHSITI